MQKASAPVLFLVGLLAVAAVGGITFAVATALDLGDDDVASGPGGTTGDAPVVDPVPGDQVQVTGLALGITVEGATLPRVDTPLTVTVPGTGIAGAGATITDVEVDGELTDVVWDGGRPLDLRGQGLGISPPDVNLFAAPSAITIGFLDGIVNQLEPGSYGLQTPVAFGDEGVARPVESIAFEATVESTIAFRGGATTALLPREMELQSTGRVLIEGDLLVSQAGAQAVPAQRVELPAGDFTVRFTPRGDGSGYDVEALLRGTVVT